MGVEAISGNVGSIRSAIAQASASTGIDFDYLLGQAQVESGLNTNARAGTSSATGLYQFLDQSWLGIIKQHGAEHGLSWAANAISGSGGRYTVSDPATRSAILNLRKDPAVSATMAAEYAADNKDAIESSLGRGATGTDLYMAHFLGLGGAKTFLRTMQSNPGASGAAMFPAAARSNRAIFYDGSGNARSLGEIYQRFAAKLDKGAAAVGATSLASDALDGSGATGMPIGPGGDFETARANFASLLASGGMGGLGDATVINGTGETGATAAAWARAALARVNGAQGATNDPNSTNLLRPTPDNARLAYMMLASMGA
jgi:hypothetical protein